MTLVSKQILNKIKSKECLEQLANLVDIIALKCKYPPWHTWSLNTLVDVDDDTDRGKQKVRMELDPEWYQY